MINNDVVAIIPARSGSKGVPKKNVKLLSGFPLLAYSIVAAKLSKQINRVVVSTDSQEFAQIARRYRAEVPFLRPAALSGDKSTDMDYMKHAIDWFLENEGRVAKYLVLLRPTTPLREPKIIDEAVKLIKRDKVATSLRSGHPAPESPYKWFVKGRRYFRAAFGLYSNDYINLPRQGFPAVYVPDGYVDIIKPSFVLKRNQLLGNRMLAFVSPACREIDTKEDYELLDFETKKNGGVIFNYLINCYGNKNKK